MHKLLEFSKKYKIRPVLSPDSKNFFTIAMYTKKMTLLISIYNNRKP